MLYPNIEAERARIGLTKEELANRLDVSPKTLVNWQSGKTNISVNKLIKLSDMFGCSVDYLLGLATQPRERAG